MYPYIFGRESYNLSNPLEDFYGGKNRESSVYYCVFPQLSLEDLKANYEKEKEKLESMAPEEQSVLEGRCVNVK